MNKIILILILTFAVFISKAQLEGVFVETYYVSDSLDAGDTTGGNIQAGSVTYRVFLDLVPGSRLLAIYGDNTHPFMISSTRSFFNNVDGSSFGYQIPKVSYESNTVALDSYLTLGGTGFQGLKKYYGVPKHQDDDGSFIGGMNNDGGSEMTEGGLLVNEDPQAGIPLTLTDGMDTLNLSVSDWFSFGVVDFMSGSDSTIFGTERIDSLFESDNFILQCEGVFGVNPDSNMVLVAQLTTIGDLSFNLNAQILDANGDTLNYVSTNEIGTSNEIFAAFLNYPQVCGCMDPDYLEYSPDYACSLESSCITPIVLGCMDSLACNYNPEANINLTYLCCYPGFCNNRDIEEVCPQIKGNSFDVLVYPNPSDNVLFLNVISGVIHNLDIAIFNYNGVEVYSESVADAPMNFNKEIDVSDFTPGIYHVHVRGVGGVKNSMMIKL